jgi:hypothetical protein
VLSVRKRKRRRGLLRLAVLIVFILLAIPTYSYVTTMMKPSSAPWTVRSVEWIRDNNGAWLVNFVEHIYYSWTVPKKGGPSLTALPTVGAADPSVKPHSQTASYLPPPISAVLSPALPGEGVWRATGRPVAGAPPVLVTVFRTDPNYPRIVAYVAWVDSTRVQLALYPGRYEPPAGLPRGPMMVPAGQRERLLATFNSGFKYKDGHGGFFVNGRTYEPMVAGLGTLVGYRDGRIDVIKWPGGAPGPDVVLARQNLPLIVDNGRPTPKLSTDSSQWGTTLGNAVRVWRSGVGIDAHGNLIYLAAPTQTVMSLAAALIHAGAVRAIQFDINVYWPTFNYYGRPGARAPVKFLPNRQNPGITRYMSPDDRDFFAVYARAGTDFSVPLQ